VKTVFPLLQLFKKYKSVIRFIIIFLGSYFIFSIIYNGYLKYFPSQKYYPDFFTHLVAVQSEAIIESLGYTTKILPHPQELSMKLFINDIFLARVVEGCNAISIIILFASFVLSFFGKVKTTFLFILAGTTIIYVMNVVRIAVLAIGIYEYPQHSEFLHSIVFPLIIYGTVFLLWIIWVRIFTKTSAL
jgi:exosortase family protein XrtF